MENPFITPDWVKDAIFYQIFPDRFASTERLHKPGNLEPWNTPPTVNGFKGGDLLGIIEHLDYLEQLGVNALYLNPIFQSASNHRYHTHDYFQVDPLLGGDRAFRRLVRQAHRRGMRIVLDGVFNHASRGFYQFNHLLECGEASPYRDWFFVHKFPLNAYGNQKPNYECWANLPALPKFNTKNPLVREFIFSVARYWIEAGIDGWRLDVPFEIDDDSFWQEFRRVVKSANPDAYLVGEIPFEAQRWLKGDQFDGVMNYPLTQACLSFFAGDKLDRELEAGYMGLPPVAQLDAAGFARRVEDLLHLYPHEATLSQLNLLGSHDTPRFLALAGGNVDALKLATLFLMTFPGVPCIYYGDEIGISYDRRRAPEAARYAFPWEDIKCWNEDLLSFFKVVIGLRKTHPALRSGDYKPLYAQGGVYAYARRLPGETLVIVLNNQPNSYHLDIPVDGVLPEQAHLTSLTGKQAGRVVHGRLTRLALAPYQGIVVGL